jgi:polyisoprenyl-teichoic acid--peptidoglycan teichoic acid transferase
MARLATILLRTSGERNLGRNDDSRDNENSNGGQEGVKRGRPRWRFVAYLLIFLVAAEIGLIAYTIKEFNSIGFFENVPIVNKASPNATITPPSNLEPADSNGDTNVSPDDNQPVNLAVGKTPIYHQDPIDPNVVNILVLGLDTRTPGGNGRSDMNMIVSIDHTNKTIKLVSILRDTLVPIEGHDWNRLNSAYAFGGPGLTINTINDAYKMDIQRYIKIDFFAIKDIIDAVGGVDIIVKQSEIDYLHTYGYKVSNGAGVKHMDGNLALEYARIRKIDGDFQRTQRQRNVLTAALAKVRAMGVVQAIDLMTTLLPQVKTNIDTNDAIDLAKEVIAMKGKEMKQMALPVLNGFTDKKYKGMSILSVDFDKNSKALRDFLYGK